MNDATSWIIAAAGAWSAVISLAVAAGGNAVAALFIPIVISLSPLLARPRRRAATIAAAILLFVFVVLGSASVGMLYMPSAIALVIAARRG